MVIAMCLVVALCVWVGWSFKNSRSDGWAGGVQEGNSIH
jgi:hypothetical protein